MANGIQSEEFSGGEKEPSDQQRSFKSTVIKRISTLFSPTISSSRKVNTVKIGQLQPQQNKTPLSRKAHEQPANRSQEKTSSALPATKTVAGKTPPLKEEMVDTQTSQPEQSTGGVTLSPASRRSSVHNHKTSAVQQGTVKTRTSGSQTAEASTRCKKSSAAPETSTPLSFIRKRKTQTSVSQSRPHASSSNMPSSSTSSSFSVLNDEPVHHIKWDGFNRTRENIGFTCALCEEDLSYMPSDDYESEYYDDMESDPLNYPEVARFLKQPKQVKQIHSHLTTAAYLRCTAEWANTLLYNTLIRAYLAFAQPTTSLLLFIHMLADEAPPNSHTFPSLIKALSSLPLHCASLLGRPLHAQALKRGASADPFVQTSFLGLYSQVGELGNAHKVFDEVSEPCVVAYNAMLDACGKNGNMGLAVSMFSSMPQRDIYSWTSMINGYARNQGFQEAVKLFKKMMAHEDVTVGLLKPNEATFVSILSSCASLDSAAALYQGKQIHGYMVKNVELSDFMATALITFYGRMGCLDYAAKVFDAIPVKKVCTWNAMISALAMNGREKRALALFEMMKATGLKPNQVTFVAVLSACAHAKLVQTGLEAFEAMSREFKIVPKMEHYGCVVDLLGRAGLVREAYEFVGRMPFEADDSVLGALLGACRVHGEIELGNEVGQRLLNLQPHHCGRYVLLSSIYAGAERWDHAAALRKAMVDAGVDKIPAYSVIH
nr:putative pentatricopeptide repeat-containing protein At1g10330 [Ipomoea batatas]